MNHMYFSTKLLQALLWSLFGFLLVVIQIPLAAQDIHANAIAWRHDGLLLAVGTDTGVMLLDKNFNPVQELPAYDERAGAVTWSPDGHFLAAVALPTEDFNFSGVPTGKAVLIWEYDPTDKAYYLTHTIDYDKPNILAIKDIVWSPTEAKLAVVESWWGGRNYQIIEDFVAIWDTNLWERVLELSYTYEDLDNLTWSPNGQFLAGYGQESCYIFKPTCSDEFGGEFGLFIADASTGERTAFTTSGDGENDIDWFGNNRLATMTGSMVFFDVLPDGTLANKQVLTSDESPGGFFQAEWLEDGRILVLYGDDTLRIINPQTATAQKLVVKVPFFYPMEVHPDQKTLAVILGNNRSLWRIQLPDISKSHFPQIPLRVRPQPE